MNRKLKINSRFTLCPIDDEDELYPNGIFVFNITKMAEYIQNNCITCNEVLAKDSSRGSSKFKESHMATVDVTKPIIVAEISLPATLMAVCCNTLNESQNFGCASSAEKVARNHGRSCDRLHKTPH